MLTSGRSPPSIREEMASRRLYVRPALQRRRARLQESCYATTQHSRAKEHLLDHAKPRCDSADGVLFSQLSKVSGAPQRRSAVRNLTTPAESKILPGRQDDSIRGPRQHATHDARIWIQLELSQSLPGPFSSLDPHLVVNQGDQAVHSPLTRGCSSRFLAQPGNQLSLREPPDTLDRIVHRRRELT